MQYVDISFIFSKGLESILIVVFVLDVNECEPINPCEHTCVDKPVGYECQCNDGFKTSPKDQSLCTDVDECAQHPRPCSQVCRNTIGSYVCSCTDGFASLHNGTSCKTNSSNSHTFIFPFHLVLFPNFFVSFRYRSDHLVL